MSCIETKTDQEEALAGLIAMFCSTAPKAETVLFDCRLQTLQLR